MTEILKALAQADLWQIALGAILVVAGSSAASAWITGGFESRRASKTFKREVRAAALQAAGEAYAVYIRYGNVADPKVYDEKRDRTVAIASSNLLARVAAIGDTSLLALVEPLVLEGELFAAQNEETSVESVHQAFSAIAFKISESIPSR